MIPKYITQHQARVILGPQDYLFTDEGVGTFLNHEWNVSSRLDRMGIRLMGPKLDVKPKPEYLMLDAGKDATSIVSDTIPVGGVQAPGRIPVILGVDGPSTGGYAKIATVISADITNLGQLRPENKIRFREVTIHQAQRALEEYEKKISYDSLLMG